jgi:hypothetical protein
MSDDEHTGLGSNRLAALAAEIRTAHAGVESAALARAARALDAGRALLEAKSLLKHGRWLPWLKEHCELPERTAQLYMKLAELDVPAELVAVFGMQAAAQTTTNMGTMDSSLGNYDEPIQREWLLFGLFVGSWEHAEWVMRHAWASPDEWLADHAWRKSHQVPELSEACLQAWAAHQQKHTDTPREQIEAALAEAAA